MSLLPLTPPLPAAGRRPLRALGPVDRVEVPHYDRAALRPGVVHLGVGRFHRAHQLTYFDELAQQGLRDWGVVGVGITNRRLQRTLVAQDNLFAVVQRDAAGSSARVVGALRDTLLLRDAPAAVVQRLADPRTKLVTITVTGDGYHPAGTGSAVFEAIATALGVRRRSGTTPFTVLSCDNLPASGTAARDATVAAARRGSAELADWIAASVAFPHTLVDRITPAGDPADRHRIEAEFGITDDCAVVTEPFRQWLIEDRFSHDRPPLDLAGARFVDDVAPYKLVKTRMLNGAHCAIGYLGSLAGHRRTDEAMSDPVLAKYVEVLLDREIAPLLPAGLPGMDLGRYRGVLLDRFRNPAVGDALSRLCARGSTKLPAYLLPSVHEARRAGAPRTLLLLAVAGWLRHLRGDDLGLELQDARADELRRLARADVRAVLRLTDIFGDLADDRSDVHQVETMLDQLTTSGVTTTLRRYLCQS